VCCVCVYMCVHVCMCMCMCAVGESRACVCECAFARGALARVHSRLENQCVAVCCSVLSCAELYCSVCAHTRLDSLQQLKLVMVSIFFCLILNHVAFTSVTPFCLS